MAEINNTELLENKDLTKPTVSQAKLAALQTARNAKSLKKMQSDYNTDIILSTLGNIYDKLNILETRVKNFPKLVKTNDDLSDDEQPAKKKPKLEITKKEESNEILSSIPKGIALFAVSLAVRYGANIFREYWANYKESTVDRDEMAWRNI